MPLVASSRTRSVVVTAAVAALAVAALSGCGPSTQPSPHSSQSASATPSGAASPSASASVTPSASPSSTPSAAVPVTLSCDQLVSRQTIYDFNPNFGLQSDYAPQAGSTAAAITAKKGIACSWLHQTSGDTLQVAVANLPEADIAARKSALTSSSHPVGDFGADGYFTTTGGAGVAEAFTGSFWIVASSTFFGEPAEAAAIVNAAAKSLRG